MPDFTWLGKEDVEKHLLKLPTHLLRCDKDLSFGDNTFDFRPDSGNLIIEGDNLLALKALIPFYSGRIKCITIDPPYNTGNEKWIYNDNVNSPQMKAWLGQFVDSEDLCRHDKWLCMMQARLRIHHELLAEDGAIFISIDDNEQHRLKLLCDEVFGERNFLGTIAWQKKYAVSNDHQGICPMYDHIVAYARSEKFQRNLLSRSEKSDKQYKFEDEGGIFRIGDYTCNKTAEERPNLYYGIVNPNTGEEVWPSKTRVWAFSRERHSENRQKNLVWWGKDGKSSVPAFKRYKEQLRGGGGSIPSNWWPHEESGHNDEARKEVREFAMESDFSTPKPTRLIERILQIATKPGDVILDSFAGSGTTGHAVLKMNEQNPTVLPRRFVLVEIEQHIARPVTRERIKRAIEGYGSHEPLGGGFSFCHLGETIFNEQFELNPNASWRDLAHFFFAERFRRAPHAELFDMATGFLGECNGVKLFLLADKDGIKPLDSLALRALKDVPGHKEVICGNIAVPPSLLERADILAKLPHEVVQ